MFFEGKKAVFREESRARAKRHYIPGYIWHITSHPSLWPFSGYNEIQAPGRKNVLIDYERLQGLPGARSYDPLRSSHKGWVEEYLGNEENVRKEEWTGRSGEQALRLLSEIGAIVGREKTTSVVTVDRNSVKFI